MRVLLTGGGTGGHVYPALAVASALRATRPDVEIGYAGTTSGMEARIVAKADLPYFAVPAAPLRGRSIIGAAAGTLTLLSGLGQARRMLSAFRPDVVLATGGYVCVPVVGAARLAGVPSLVFLPDVEPGLAVRVLARIATGIAVSTEVAVVHFPPAKVVVSGYPVRPELGRMDRNQAREVLHLPVDATVLLVFGGSRGARTINLAVEAHLRELLAIGHVVHIAGIEDEPRHRSLIDDLPAPLRERYRVYPYLHEEMGAALSAADLVVCRAGASTLGELPAFGLPAVLVPYPYAGAHQRRNAEYLAQRGAAVSVENDVVQGGGLLPVIRDLLSTPERLAEMRAASRRLARPDAATNIATRMIELAGTRSALPEGA